MSNNKLEKDHKMNRNAVLQVTIVFLSVCVIASMLISVLLYSQTKHLISLVEKDVMEKSDETQEDGVTIAGEYKVMSTKNISDAYVKEDRSKLSDKEKEILDMASKVLDEIIFDDMDDYEKELAVYEWMIDNLENDTGILTVIPTTQKDCDNPYGVLKYHNAVCVGYATTFRLFMQMLEIPCMVVHNNEMFHSWDLVQLEGNWYHCDIYSDMESKNYSHFNMNDAMCSRSQDWDYDYYPKANSVELNLGYQNRIEGVDVFDLPQKVREMIDNGEFSLFMIYNQDFTEREAKIATQILSQINDQMGLGQGLEEDYLNYSFVDVSDGYLLMIYLNYEEDKDFENSISEEDNIKIEKAITKAFSDFSFDSIDLDWEEYDESFEED